MWNRATLGRPQFIEGIIKLMFELLHDTPTFEILKSRDDPYRYDKWPIIMKPDHIEEHGGIVIKIEYGEDYDAHTKEHAQKQYCHQVVTLYRDELGMTEYMRYVDGRKFSLPYGKLLVYAHMRQPKDIRD